MVNHKWLSTAMGLVAILACSSVAMAGSLSIESSPYVASGFNGGEFTIYDTTGLGGVGLISDAAWYDRNSNGVKDEWQTFCLERSENFPRDNEFWIGEGAVKGGLDNDRYIRSGADAIWDVNGVNNYDPISEATAYLYSQFWNGTLSNYDYDKTAGTTRDISARSLQRAIWQLEDEGTPATGNSDTQALDWIDEAVDAVLDGSWSGFGAVRVLNLYTVDAVTGAITNRQSQLIVVPLPASALMGLGLLCAIGAYRGLRRKNRVV